MSINIEVDGGKSVRLKTAGKYCDKDIVVTATGSSTGNGSDAFDALIDRSITEVNSGATSIGTDAFRNCTQLTSVYFHKATSIGSNTFFSCSQLTAVILRSETLCTLSSTTAFSYCYHILGTVNSTYNPNGDKDGYFYVPRALVEDYKVATNWSTFASQFRALEDYTVDGTITGELDPNKIAPTPANLITFTIDGTSYQAEPNMTWGEWVNSAYNTINAYDSTPTSNVGVIWNGSGTQYVMNVYNSDTITVGGAYAWSKSGGGAN